MGDKKSYKNLLIYDAIIFIGVFLVMRLVFSLNTLNAIAVAIVFSAFSFFRTWISDILGKRAK